MRGRNCSGPVQAGALLLEEEPFVFALSNSEQGQRCDCCLVKGKVLKCSGCNFVHYCGRSCQKDAWREHKWECSNMKRCAPKVLPDSARMLARIICRLSKGDGNTYRAFYLPKSFRMWKDLMSHYSDLKVDKRRMEHFTSLSMVLYEFFKDMSLPNTVELMGIYGRMCINSFTILDVDMNSIGTALYIGASVVDHSCKPNAVATFHGTTINIRATEDMPTLDWGQIRISYIDLMKTAYERQAELMQNYYFLCQCERCMDEQQIKLMHGAKCPNIKCDNPVQIPWKQDCQLVKTLRDNEKTNGEYKLAERSVLQTNGTHDETPVVQMNGSFDKSENGRLTNPPVHCTECGTKVSEKQVEAFQKAMEFTELHLQNMKNASTAYVDVCKYCLDKQDGVVHPLNVMRAQTLDHAFDALIDLQLWDQACGYAEMLIPCFRNYYGERHPLMGLLHLKYGKILLYKMKIHKSLEHFKISQKILKITHGEKSQLYRELIMLLEQAMIEAN